MTLVVQTIMGGYGRLVTGSDGLPAAVGVQGPLTAGIEVPGQIVTSRPFLRAVTDWPNPRGREFPIALRTWAPGRNRNLLT